LHPPRALPSSQWCGTGGRRYGQKESPAKLSSQNAPAARPRSFQAGSAQQPRVTGSRRVYEFALNQFITWYCSEPRLAFNRVVVTRYRMYLESRGLAANTINQQLAAVRRIAHEAADRLAES